MSITLIGARVFGAKLTRIATTLEVSNVNEAMGLETENWIRANFARSGKPVGGWKKLSPVTKARRKKKGAGSKILIDTGAMRGSINSTSDKNSARVGLHVEYSKNHDKGIGVPRRRILPTKKEITPFLVARVQKRLRSLL